MTPYRFPPGPRQLIPGSVWFEINHDPLAFLDRLAREYGEFVEAFSREVSSDPLVRVIDLVHAWRRFPWIDPGLPAQFLPAPWRGTAAAELFARRHAEWADDAIAEWKQLLTRT